MDGFEEYEQWQIDLAHRTVEGERRSAVHFHRCIKCGSTWSLMDWLHLDRAPSVRVPDGGLPDFEYRVCRTDSCGQLLSERTEIVDMVCRR